MMREVGDFLYENLSYKIRGCAFKVYNQLGFGHRKNIYQNALASEFKKEGIDFEKEKGLPVIYGGEKIGIYRPDFVVAEKIIIELKSVSFLPKEYETQLTYYLKGTNYKLGFLINFGANKIEIRRRVWTPNYQR